jgi:drug/metabolite transporter (DMT)-like permease
MTLGLLTTTVVLATLLWPVSRWVVKRGGRPEAFGLSTAVAAAALTTPAALWTGQALDSVLVWCVGATIGIAFAVGYFLVIMHCLRLGPTGPTAAANNMGLVWPVLCGLVWPVPRSVGLTVGVGLALVVAGLILFGLASSATAAAGRPATPQLSRRWLAWVLLGWALAGVSMTAQYVGSVLVPHDSLALTACFYVVTAVVLAGVLLARRQRRPSRSEMAAGAVNGMISAAAVVTTLLTLNRARAEIVFPVTVAMPILLVLVLSAGVYRERLGGLAWAACGAGGAGLVLLTVGG